MGIELVSNDDQFAFSILVRTLHLISSRKIQRDDQFELILLQINQPNRQRRRFTIPQAVQNKIPFLCLDQIQIR